MKINPYLNFDGRCEEAFNFYAKVLGGKIESKFTFAEAPPEMGSHDDWKGKIMHARLAIGDQVILGSDAPPGRYSKPAGTFVSLSMKDPNEGKRIFESLSTGGQSLMPFGKTFWSPGFGMCIDKYGVPWMVNCE
jgi:PhnB protein